MENLIKDYILGLLRWQETKLKCINLGWTSNKEIKAELELIKKAKKIVDEKM